MSRRTRGVLLPVAAVLGLAGAAVGLVAIRFWARLERVDPTDRDAFRSPYYLYLPRSLESAGEFLHLLVVPNNTGRPDDDEAVHRRASLVRVFRARGMAEELRTPLLVPCFPRPASHWRVYTHALDRDTFTTPVPELARLDRQLQAMIDDARERVTRRTRRAVASRVLITGFSAGGMFANRFAVLRPDRVLAMAAGSPGGWPLAPVASWEGESLRYPIGIADLEALLGAAPGPARLLELQAFLFQGGEDTNDSVAFGDGWDPEDRDLVNACFGGDLRSRFAAAELIWRRVLPEAVFKTYPGVGHERTAEMDADVVSFFRRAMAASR